MSHMEARFLLLQSVRMVLKQAVGGAGKEGAGAEEGGGRGEEGREQRGRRRGLARGQGARQEGQEEGHIALQPGAPHVYCVCCCRTGDRGCEVSKLFLPRCAGFRKWLPLSVLFLALAARQSVC